MGCNYSSNKAIKCYPSTTTEQAKATKPNVPCATTLPYLPDANEVPSDSATWQNNFVHNSTSKVDNQSTNVILQTRAHPALMRETALQLRTMRQVPLPPRTPTNNMLECCICYESMPASSTSTSLHSANPCDSAHFVCRGCAYMYLKNKVEERTVGPNLHCPANCGEVLAADDVRNFLNSANESNYAAWHVLLEKFNETYKAATAVESARDRRLRRWLPLATDVATDVKFALWRCGHDARRCPGCKIIIEKNGGCQHMTCRGCRHEFWWCCGQAYKGKHRLRWCSPSSGIRSVAHSTSRFWGPNVPVRAITKVTASCIGFGLGVTAAAVSVVVVPLYLGGCTLSAKSGFKDWRRGRRQRRRTPLQRRPIPPQMQRTVQALRINARAGDPHDSIFALPKLAFKLLRTTTAALPALARDETPKKLVLEVPLGAKAVAKRRAKFALAVVALLLAMAVAIAAAVAVVVVAILAVALVWARAKAAIGLEATVALSSLLLLLLCLSRQKKKSLKVSLGNRTNARFSPQNSSM